ncbi:MAG: hypothetical protein ACOYJA_12175, partial [Christensenellales bacterium]
MTTIGKFASRLSYSCHIYTIHGRKPVVKLILKEMLHLLYLGPAEKSDSRYGRSFKQLLVLSQPILQSNLRSSARAKKELKG